MSVQKRCTGEKQKQASSPLCFANTRVRANKACATHLVMGKSKALQDLLVIKLLNGHLARLAKRHVSQQNVCAKGQRVHVLCSRRKHLPALDQLGALRLCLTRRLRVCVRVWVCGCMWRSGQENMTESGTAAACQSTMENQLLPSWTQLSYLKACLSPSCTLLFQQQACNAPQ